MTGGPAAVRRVGRGGALEVCVDGCTDGWLHGWAALGDEGAPKSLDCTIDGEYIGTCTRFHLRPDVRAHGRCERVGFRLRVPEHLLDGASHIIRIHAFTCDAKVGEHRAELRLGVRVANANPHFILSPSGRPEPWQLTSAASVLRFCTMRGVSVPGGLRQFLRISIEASVTLFQSTIPRLPPPATLLVVARSITGATLGVRLEDDESKEVLLLDGPELVQLDNGWISLRLPVSAPDKHQTLHLEVSAVGRHLVDIACAGIVPGQPSEAVIPNVSLDEPPSSMDTEASWKLRPRHWERGLRVRSPAPGDALLRGWFYDGSETDESFEALRSRVDGSRALSLAVNHQRPMGPSRICAEVPRPYLLSLPRGTLTWSVDNLDPDGADLPVSLVVLGTERGSTTVLARRRCDPLTRGSNHVVQVFDHADVQALATNAVDFSQLAIALEFTQPYHVRIHSVGAVADPEPPTSPARAHRSFEARSVAAQAGDMVTAPRRPSVSPDVGDVQLDVIVPVHDAPGATAQCLGHLIDANDGSYRILVIDDASGIQTARLLRRVCGEADLALHRNPTNQGYTASANHGIRLTTAPIVALVNSDALVPAGWHRQLLSVFQSDPSTGLVGPLSSAASWQSVPLRHDHRGDWMKNPIPGGDVNRFQRWLEASWEPRLPALPLLNGFCLAIRRQVIDAVGLLDEVHFPVGYGEENDLCVRATAAGWQLRCADQLYVFHAKSRSFGKRRAPLTMAGAHSLRRKHPDVSWERLSEELASHPDLLAVRRHIVQHWGIPGACA